MLHPDPVLRITIEEILSSEWVLGILVKLGRRGCNNHVMFVYGPNLGWKLHSTAIGNPLGRSQHFHGLA
jgi:hypothetical protein